MLKVRIKRISLEEATSREWVLVGARPHDSQDSQRRSDFPVVLEYLSESGTWVDAELVDGRDA